MTSNAAVAVLSWQEGPTLRTISAHHEDILLALTENSEVAIDIADDKPVDLSLIQLVESARIYASTSGKKLTLVKPAGGQLLDTLERGGFLQNLSPEDANFWLHDGVMK